MADDITEFLRKAAQRRAQQQQNAPPPPPQPPVSPFQQQLQDFRNQQPADEIVDVEIVYEDDSVTSLPQHQFHSRIETRDAHLAEVPDHADERMESHLQEVFDHSVGDLRHKEDAYDRSLGEMTEFSYDEDSNAGKKTPPSIDQMIKLLKDPNSIRSAFILMEVFKPREF